MFLYTIKKSLKAKYIRITIAPDMSIVVTLPYQIDEEKADFFIGQKREWIEKSIEKIKKRKINDKPFVPLIFSKKDLAIYKEKALILAEDRLLYFNQFYGYTWNKVTIKNVSSRWGSCSKNKNLNFSYKIVFLPKELQDYIVVHELCHLGEFNHSLNFWGLVAKTMPEYKKCKEELRSISI